jgi:uncharacterized membrane protein YfhO
MQDNQKNALKYLLYGGLLSILIGFAAFAPIWIFNEGRLLESGDYYAQYVPFLMEMKRMLSQGGLGWSWNSFLGDSYVSAYSYYTVFNPFAWFVMLFPESSILYATMAAALLKLAVGTIGAMLYLRRFVQKDIFALIGALLYTFSGFTAVNTSFYFFQDVIALFPYLLYGLELLITNKKSWVYVIALALNAAINFYFFVSTVFLVILYVLFRLELYRIRGWKQNGGNFIRIAIWSIVGTALAAIALLPSLYSILGSGKASSSFGNAWYVRTYSIPDLLERLRVLLAPIESINYHAFYDCSSWCSIAAYLPVFGCLLALEQCIHKRDWLGKLLLLLAVCYVVPILNSVFNLFTAAHYSRWLYAPVLWLALATAQYLERWEQTGETIRMQRLLVYTVAAAGLVLVPGMLNLMCRFGRCMGTLCTSEYFFGFKPMIVMMLLTIADYCLLWYLLRLPRCRTGVILLWVVIASAFNYAVYNQLNYNPKHESRYVKTMEEGTGKTEVSFRYRIDHPKEIHNYSLFQNQPAVHNYNSLQNLGSTKFAVNTGFIDNMSTVFLNVPEESRTQLDALLSVRYYMDYNRTGTVPEGFVYLRTENGVDVYENRNYIPMGFVYDRYVIQESLDELTPAQRVRVMLSALVVSEEDAQTVSRLLTQASAEAESISLEEAVSRRNETHCSFFEGTSQGFTAEISLKSDNVVFFSVPMDDGWQITVNGEPAKVVRVHYGLLGILCGQGENTIQAVYHSKGLSWGAACSGGTALLWLVWELLQKKKRIVK